MVKREKKAQLNDFILKRLRLNVKEEESLFDSN